MSTTRPPLKPFYPRSMSSGTFQFLSCDQYRWIDPRADSNHIVHLDRIRAALSRFGERIPLAYRQLQMLQVSLDEASAFREVPGPWDACAFDKVSPPPSRPSEAGSGLHA